MSEPMPYADLVILALIAGFILLRLRNVLGQKTGHKPDRMSPQTRQQASEPIITLPERLKHTSEEPVEVAEIDSSLVADKARPGLEEIQKNDASFSADSFLSGAKMAFEMVFDAFSKGEKDKLKQLLSAETYKDFHSEIEQRKNEDRRADTTLVAIESVKIADAEKHGRQARITVHFISEQITVMRDRESKIVEGDPSQVSRVEDEWTFERDISSRNPNWKIVAT